MDTTLFPTKGNLILAKNTLKLSKQGYELLDRKRNILIQELMELISTAENIQFEINKTFLEAYAALQSANISMGINRVEALSLAVPIEDKVSIKTHSVMGIELPIVSKPESKIAPPFGFFGTTTSLDIAYKSFEKVKELTLKLAMIENSAYRLAVNIKKTQKRANALKNVMIPKYENLSSYIQNYLEEKEREDFARLKVIKNFTKKD